jgi:G3E family GTPase
VARDAVITMVDAATFLSRSREQGILDEQVKATDFLVLNKIDLASEREPQRVETHLWRLNRRALLLQAAYGQVQTDLLLGTGIGAYRAWLRAAGQADGAPAAHHAHGQDGIQAFLYET